MKCELVRISLLNLAMCYITSILSRPAAITAVNSNSDINIEENGFFFP